LTGTQGLKFSVSKRGLLRLRNFYTGFSFHAETKGLQKRIYSSFQEKIPEEIKRHDCFIFQVIQIKTYKSKII